MPTNKVNDSSFNKPESTKKPDISPESLPTLEAMEEKLISMAIEKNNGNLTAAAEQLGITRQTLYNKFRKNKPDVK